MLPKRLMDIRDREITRHRSLHSTAQWRKGMLTNNGAELTDEGVRVKELFIIGSHFDKLSMKQIDHKRNKDCN